MKKILITGGAGFIGSNLAKKLLLEGNKVTCIDNFVTGNKLNLAELDSNKNFKLIAHDINQSFAGVIDDDVHEIYNLACPASPPKYQQDPLFTIHTNTIGSFNVLNFAVEKNAKILQASTSEIYGDPLEHPQKESYFGNVNILGPRSCYDEGKRIAETIFMEYNNKFGVPIKIARIFNTYGPKMAPDDGRVISNFIMQSLNNKDITIYGDGTQTRSFQYIDDLLDGLTSLMDSDDSFIGPVNLGNPDEFTINDLANKIIKLTGSKSKVSNLPCLQDDPKLRRPDITMANQKLNWSPKVPLVMGLFYTTGYFRKNYMS